MLNNIIWAWCITFGLIVGYEYIHHKYIQGKVLSASIAAVREIVLIFCSVFYYTASAFIGALGALYIWPPNDVTSGRFESLAGVFVGIWALAIFLQMALNIARKLAGAPTQPIIFYNKNLFAFLRIEKREDKD